MATIQRADGIKEMVSALALLLKEISKGASEKITLQEELELVRVIFIYRKYVARVCLEYIIDSR